MNCLQQWMVFTTDIPILRLDVPWHQPNALYYNSIEPLRVFGAKKKKKSCYVVLAVFCFLL